MQEWLAARQITRIEEATRDEMARDLAAAPDRLRIAFRQLDLPLAPLVEGVRQDSFSHLERTLLQLAALYEQSAPAQQRSIRALVITARQHACWALRSSRATPQARSEKQEMELWMHTWLENPTLFATWLPLRKRAIAASA